MQSSFLQPVTITNGRTMPTTLQRDASEPQRLRRYHEQYLASASRPRRPPLGMTTSRHTPGVAPRMLGATKDRLVDRYGTPSHSAEATDQREMVYAPDADAVQRNREHWIAYRHMDRAQTRKHDTNAGTSDAFIELPLPARDHPRLMHKVQARGGTVDRHHRAQMNRIDNLQYHPYPVSDRAPPFPNVVPSYGMSDSRTDRSRYLDTRGFHERPLPSQRRIAPVTKPSRKEYLPLPPPSQSSSTGRNAPRPPAPPARPSVRCTYCLNQ